MSDSDSDKRGAARRRTILAGKIVYGNGGSFTTPCTIRDINESGARIKLPSLHQTLPSSVLLIDVRQGAAYVAEVVWNRPPEFGLHFTARHDMNALPTEISYLRRIWVDASVR